MGFRIGYERLLALYCWHPAFLGAATGWPTRPARTPATDAEVENDLLGYDLRDHLRLELTPGSARDLARHGLYYRTTTTGAWVLGPTDFPSDPTTARVRIALYARSPRMTALTDFHRSPVTEGQLLVLTDDGLPAGAPGDIQLLSDGDFSGRYRDYTAREAAELRPGVLGLIDLPLHERRGQAFDLLFTSPPVLNP